MQKASARNDLRPRFDTNTEFQNELRARVNEYFRMTGLSPRDCPQMYLKTGILLTFFAACYAFLVFVAASWWQALPAAILLGFSGATVGLNIQHDGIHHAYSRRRWVNRAAGLTLDLLGGSSYFYRGQHVVFHHTYTNIEGADTDIDLGIFGRMAPEQRRLRFHRFQHYYLWLLYGFMVIQWHFVTDFQALLTGRISKHQFPRPRGWELLTVIGGKALFFGLAFGLPLLVHPFWTVALFYAVSAMVIGISLAVVFQLAHCVEQAEFPMPQGDTGRMSRPWAVHQVETTVDFARRNRLVTWLLGGLNFQIEHHLFPRISHIHYPAIAEVVEDSCRRFGIRYAEHRTFGAGLTSHFRYLRSLGRPLPEEVRGHRWRQSGSMRP